MDRKDTTPDKAAGHWRRCKDRLLAERRRALESNVRAGVAAYRRERDLPRVGCADPLLPLPASVDERKALLIRLDHALRCERTKARAGHWTYDLNRHIALKQAREAEAALLAGLLNRQIAGGPDPGSGTPHPRSSRQLVAVVGPRSA